MNFYPHHIGDFNNATRHLTRVERSVYREAIELYYDTEQPLIGDFKKLAKKLLCQNEEEKEALKDVLEEFFIKGADGYEHERCEIELEKYRANSTAKAKAGKASAEARRRKKEQKQDSTDAEQVLDSVESQAEQKSTNHEPVTSNHEPLKTIDQSSLDHDAFDFLFETFWNAGMTKTGKKKASATFLNIIKKLKDETPADFTSKLVLDIQNRLLAKQLGFDSMHPQTYLNGERWLDELPQPASTSTRDTRLVDNLTDRSWANG